MPFLVKRALWLSTVLAVEISIALAGVVLTIVQAESRFLLPVIVLRLGLVGTMGLLGLRNRLWAIWALVILEGGVALVFLIVFVLFVSGRIGDGSSAGLAVAAVGTGCYGGLAFLSVGAVRSAALKPGNGGGSL